ncbi:hypothetical protein [Aliamphritea spongicola]|nr:hypothetical protein [Aliamphritea spongicola]
MLGPVFLTRFKQALGVSNGDLSIFLTRPISLTLLSLTVGSILIYA